MTGAPRDDGYALVAAVAAIAVFSILALQMTSNQMGDIQTIRASKTRAQLAAATDAGLALAVHGLASTDRANRWSIDGRTRNISFSDISLAIRVEDERSKIPISLLEDQQMNLMLETAGLTGDALRIATDSMLDWLDDDDEARSFGAESDYYLAKGLLPRNGRVQSIDEIVYVRGMTPVIVAKIKPYLTLWYGQSSSIIRERNALPFALAVMSGTGMNSPAVIQRQRELAGQRTAIEIGEAESLVGQPLKIIVEAQDQYGGYFRRDTIIELSAPGRTPAFFARQLQ